MGKVFGFSVMFIVTSQTAVADAFYTDKGRVLSVAPQVERSHQPRQECHTEYVRESMYDQPARSNSGAVVGGVTGGLLGSTIGRGSGRIAAAAVGAGLGALVGDRVDNRDSVGRERIVTRPVEQCVTVDQWQTMTTGYVVNYEYQGRQYSTLMDHDPGASIELDVTVSPRQAQLQPSYRPAAWQTSPLPRNREHGRRRDFW